MIDGDHMGLVADAPGGHRLGEPSRRRDLDGNRIVGVGDVGRPVDVDRAGDVRRQVLLACAPIIGLLDARRNRTGHHVSPDVDDADVRVAQVLRQPLGRDEEALRPLVFSLRFPGRPIVRYPSVVVT